MIGASWRRRESRHARALTLLDREREALLTGAMTELASVVAAREALVSELLDAAVPPPDGFLAALKTKAERNGRLLLAGIAGLKAARDQIAEAERTARSLRTYRADGAAVDVGAARSTRDQRR